MTKLHFSAGVPELKPRPPSAKFTRWSEHKPHPSPLCKMQGAARGREKKGAFLHEEINEEKETTL